MLDSGLALAAPTTPIEDRAGRERKGVRQMSGTDALVQARIDLTAALRWASRLGFSEGVCNHFSLVAPGLEGRVLSNPQGLHWAEITAADSLVFGGQGP